jgi:hypothetical protein
MVIGNDGAINQAESGIKVRTKSEAKVIRCNDGDKHFDLVYDKFAESIEKGELVEPASAYDGMKATEAAFQALESAKERN